MAGGVAALASWPPLYPLDVLRTRIQTADPKLNLTYRDHYRQVRVRVSYIIARTLTLILTLTPS